MDQRLAIGGAIALGVVLALVAALLLAPDTGGSLAEAPPPIEAPAPVRVQAAPSPAPAARPAPSPDLPDVPPPLPGTFLQEVAPRPPVDPDKVYDVEDRGIASALFDRYPRMVSCYMEHMRTFGPVDGRPVVRATVNPEPDDEGSRVQIHIENRGTALDSLDACFAEAMSDAQFGEVDVPTTVLQPIPLPRRE